MGDGNNVAHSLMLLGAKAGVEVAVATPPELAPAPERAGRASVGPARSERRAAAPHALYADVWVSMGDEDEADAPARAARAVPARRGAAGAARDDAIALHCLPAHPGEEISEGVLYGPRSAVFDQAENRLHAQKALLELLVRIATYCRGHERLDQEVTE